jgi:hypothetical protein
MAPAHASTAGTQIQVVGQLIGHQGEYGTVTLLSRQQGVSRQTLYQWRGRGQQALEQVFAPAPPPPLVGQERAILTFLVAGHAGYRGIQECLAVVGQPVPSLGTISRVVQEACRRALALQRQPVGRQTTSIALDEIYGNDRHGGYLSVVDTQSGVVWGAAGPVAVDGESWTLLLWLAQERGLRWFSTVHDGGKAMEHACAHVDPHGQHQRDVWHVLHECAKVQGRLDRQVARLEEQTATVARQAARVAAGRRPVGHHPQSDPAVHSARLGQARQSADGLRYLSGELRHLLGVVVLQGERLLDRVARQAELDVLLALLADLREGAPSAMQAELARVHRGLVAALPALLCFTEPLDQVHQQVSTQVAPAQVALVAWAWQRQAVLGPARAALLEGFPPAWRPAAALLCAAWDHSVRASSVVENWHSVLRPHLAVHRTLSTGLLALLAVYHNHRVAPRGVHQGTSPLQRSGLAAPADWLTALGYPPTAAALTSHRTTPAELPMAA